MTPQPLPAGTTLVRQGQPGTDIYLVLDGIIRVERAGETLADYGPCALLGARAPLEGGVRTSSLVAVTPCRVFDTRSGTGTCAGIPTPAVTKGTVPPDGLITVTLTGVAGIPSTATVVFISLSCSGGRSLPRSNAE